MGDLVIKAGVPGMLFPSMRSPGGISLVAYLDLVDGSDQRHVRVHDPEGKLPKTRASWNP